MEVGNDGPEKIIQLFCYFFNLGLVFSLNPCYGVCMLDATKSKAAYYAVLETGWGREDRQVKVIAEDSVLSGCEAAVHTYLMEHDLPCVGVYVYSQEGYEGMVSWEPDEHPSYN